MAISIEQLTGLESLTKDEMNLVGRQLSYFAAKGSQSYVSDLIDFLVQNVLATLPLGKHPPKEIHGELVKQTKFKFEFEQVLRSLERLVNNKDIYSMPDVGEYYLREYGIDPAHKKAVTDKFNEQVKLENQVMDEWSTNLKEKYPELNDEQLAQITSDLEAFSLRVYSQHSVESVLLYKGNDENIVKLLEQLDINSLGDILPVRDPVVHKIRLLELPKFFYEASTERKIYIGKKLNQLFIMHMMQLDPKCAKLAAQTITGGTLFLDTNFVIRLVGIDGAELQDASSRLVKLSQGLGYTVAVTPKTVEEYKYKVNELVATSKSSPSLPAEIAEAALSQTASRDFLTHYWKRSKEASGYLSLEAYLRIFQNLEALLEQYGVIIDPKDDAVIRNNKKAVLDEMVLMRKLVGHLDLTHDAVIEHDAHHRLLILRLRQGYEEKTPLEIPYWFLTCDTKLPVYDRRARARPDNPFKIPFCVLSSQWMQLLRPFAGAVDEMAIVQADTLDSPLFRAFRNPSTELLQEIITRMSANKDVPPKTIAKIITNDAFVRAFNDADDETKESLIQGKTEDELLIKYQEDIGKLTDEMSRLSSENSALVDKLNNLTKNYEEAINKEKFKKEEREEYARQRQELEGQLQVLQVNYASVQKQLSFFQSNRDKISNQNQARIKDMQELLERMTDENKKTLEKNNTEMQSLRDELESERKKASEERAQWNADKKLLLDQQISQKITFIKQQKSIFIGLVGMAFIAALIALSPWKEQDNVKLVPIALSISAILIQVIAFTGIKIKSSILTLLIFINAGVFLIAISVLLGLDISTTIVFVCTIVQAAVAVLQAVLELRKES